MSYVKGQQVWPKAPTDASEGYDYFFEYIDKGWQNSPATFRMVCKMVNRETGQWCYVSKAVPMTGKDPNKRSINYIILEE